MPLIAVASTAGARQGQAQRIYAEYQRVQRRFTLGVTISWVVQLFLLVLVFSGLQISWGPEGFLLNVPATNQVLLSLPVSVPFGPLVVRTIRLDWDFIRTWAPDISRGVWQTIGISALSIVSATLLALLAALGGCRASRQSTRCPPSTSRSSAARRCIYKVLFFFLALPQLGINLPGLWAGVLALGLNYGAYMSEIFRAGILAVSKGQREAALALGMTYGQLMRRIVLPQALRFALPPTGNEFIAMLKDSALVSATGFVHEILWRATKAGRANFRNLEALIIAAVFYWVMTLVFSALQSRLEKYMARGER
jgi:polar amino acid transport system permease protein